MAGKTEQLQIRLTPQQKAALKRHARAAGTDVSAYVLARLLPEAHDPFGNLLDLLRRGDDQRFVLAELNDFLHGCPRMDFADAVREAHLGGLSDFQQNYVAAMVETAASDKRIDPPRWVAAVTPLTSPMFATPMRSLRLHLLRASPVPFKRRNIFIDSTVGDRV